MKIFENFRLVCITMCLPSTLLGQDFIDDFTNLDWFLENKITKVEIQEKDSTQSEIKRFMLFNPQDSVQVYQEIDKSNGEIRGEMKLKFDRFGKAMEFKGDSPVMNIYRFDSLNRIIKINGTILLEYENEQNRLIKKETEYSNDMYRTIRITNFSYDSTASKNMKSKLLEVFSGYGDHDLIYQSDATFFYNTNGLVEREIVRMNDQTADVTFRHEYVYDDKKLVNSISTYRDDTYSNTLFFKYSFFQD